MVRQMAVNHPVAGIVGDELDVGSLGDSHQNRVLRSPSGLRLPPTLCACHDKRVPVQVNRMVVHSQVDEAQADAIVQPGLSMES